MYKSFARTDLLEIEKLQELSQKKKAATKITLGAIYATFGQESIFTKLPH